MVVSLGRAVIGIDALKQPDLPQTRTLPVSVAWRMASVLWLRRQSAHKVRARGQPEQLVAVSCGWF
jgi:hypothetical protein